MGARSINRNERFNAIGDVIRTMSSAEAMRRLNEQEVPNGPVNHPREKVINDPQMQINKLIFETDHPHAPALLRQCRPAAQFSNSPFEISRHAPLLGQDTRSVLADAGVSQGEIDALMREKVIVE